MSEKFSPTEVWELREKEMSDYSVAVQETIEWFNGQPFGKLMSQIPESRLDANGTRILVINPDDVECSKDEAILVFNPYNNGIDTSASSPGNSSNALMALFMFEAARRAGFTDQKGLPRRLIMEATPSFGSTVKMTRSERKLVSKGELLIPTTKKLESVEQMGIGKLVIVGYSRGGLDALDSPAVIKENEMGLDIISLTGGDPPSSGRKGIVRFGIELRRSLKEVQEIVEHAEIDVFMLAQGFGEHPDENVQQENMRVGARGLRSLAALAVLRGLTKGGTGGRLISAEANTDAPITIVYSGDPIISPDKLEEDLEGHPGIYTVRVDGAGHAHYDDKRLYAEKMIVGPGDRAEGK